MVVSGAIAAAACGRQLRLIILNYQVAGKRRARALAVLRCRAEMFLTCAIGIVLEPLEFLTHYFMWASNRLRDFTSWPPLMDLVWACKWPLVAAQQYLSELLRGTAPRLRLRWQSSESSCFAEWAGAHPDEAMALRRLILMAIGLAHWRHSCKLLSYPWRLVALGDERRPIAERLRLAEAFRQASPCCLPFGLARDLRAMPDMSAERLCSPAMRKVWLVLAWETLTSLSTIERLHARNRRCADPQHSGTISRPTSSTRR